MLRNLSPLQRLLFLKNRGKEGKAEKRDRRKNRERKEKAKKASARFLSKYGARPGGGCALRCLHAGLWNKDFSKWRSYILIIQANDKLSDLKLLQRSCFM